MCSNRSKWLKVLISQIDYNINMYVPYFPLSPDKYITRTFLILKEITFQDNLVLTLYLSPFVGIRFDVLFINF